MRLTSFAILLLASCGGASLPGVVPDGLGPWGEREDLPRRAVPLEGAPSRGGESPLVHLVVFSDFECTHCIANAGVLRRLLERHPDSLRVYHRHLPLPFHPHAEGAAQATEEARVQRGEAGFWAMHDRLFADTEPLDEARLEAHASAVGLDVAAFRTAMTAQRHADRIGADVELADRVGADGTPTMFVNGRPIYGALPFAQFDLIVEEEIALAREALHHGVPRSAIYTVALRSAREPSTPPPPEPAPSPDAEPDLETLYAVPIDGAPSLGVPDGTLTVVMFSDFQCPYCARALATLAALAERYGRELRVVFRHFPLASHPDGAVASQAVVEAYAQGGDASFWRMHDALMSRPRELDLASLTRVAQELGLDVPRFTEALRTGQHESVVERDIALGRQFGVRSTPTFFVNGRMIVGAQPLDVFIDAAEDGLARARATREAGHPPGEVYRAMLADAATSVRWRAGGAPVEIPIPDDAPRRGAEEPEIVVQMFSDLECPYCAQVQPTLNQLLRDHPQVQLVFRHYPLPFHPEARAAAVAALEVRAQQGDDGFWRFHDRILLGGEGTSRAAMLAVAAEQGADAAEVGRAIDEDRHGARVDADIAAVRRAGLRIGTPTFLIRGRVVAGAQPYEVFARALEAPGAGTDD